MNIDYDTQQVARLLHISVKTLHNKLSRGDKNLPPSYRIGRKRLFPIREFKTFLDLKRDNGNAKNKLNAQEDKS
ncbi:MAG: hypothetical protein ACI9T7_000660 [Oleiphilaceae bacterium]|jgi:hypothetical protein